MQLVAGPLADRYGRRPVLLVGLAMYALACVACALAPTIGILIAARFAQAIGCCAAVVVARAIIRDAFDAQAGAHVLARASSIVAIGPLFGPILGSVLEVRFGYRAAFVVVAAIAAMLLAVTMRRLPETNLHPDPARDAPARARLELRRRDPLACVPRVHARRCRELRRPVRVHHRVAVRADAGAGCADRVVRALLRVLRVGLPAGNDRVSPSSRRAQCRADDAVRRGARARCAAWR